MKKGDDWSYLVLNRKMLFVSDVSSSASLIPPPSASSQMYGAVEPPSALPTFIETSGTAPSDDTNPLNIGQVLSSNTSTASAAFSSSASYNPAASAFYPKTFRYLFCT